MADGPEVVASSAFGEDRGMPWLPALNVSPQRDSPWTAPTPTPTPSLTQREGAGLGVAPGAQPPRDLPLGGAHRFLYPLSPRKSPIAFHHNHMLLWKI